MKPDVEQFLNSRAVTCQLLCGGRECAMERSAAARDDDERSRSRWELVRAGLGEPGGPERKEPFSVEGVGGAGADCVEGMGSSHVRESWACTEPGVPQRCGFRRHWGDCPFAFLQRWGYWAPSEPPASWRSSAARIWLSHSAPSWRPFGSWSSRSQRHVAIIASTRIRQSRSRS